ncbi:uncharacterized protein FRV6_02761 [Fusarium oxysporum]|uniref:Uncharacterized protein n=1 Tax=Fusarium oxysporum TaxID=5507 RepID=A0A2H3SPZ9_FUSOX|nr:uncharacterized protein FRV6_02761 [Fusarium oxysporum]
MEIYYKGLKEKVKVIKINKT